ncbi:AMP-binding protein [Nocardia aobensis]|uniref:AMP-binding protein n=1 Tax=Nocardia aobensis TaxID=257277 RepID=A0ABW6P9K4_9NOCA
MPRGKVLAFGPRLLDSDSVWRLLTDRAAVSGRRTMLVSETGERLDYTQVAEQAGRVATALHDMGIGPGTRVAWQLPTRLSTVLVMLALSRLGAVQAPIDPLLGRRETGAAIASAQAEVLLVPGTWRGIDYRARASAVSGVSRVLTIGPDAPAGAGQWNPARQRTGSWEKRWIFFSAGKSGLPKGAYHTDASLLAAARGLALRARLGEVVEDIAALALPIACAQSAVALLAALQAGVGLILMEHFDPGHAVGVLRQNGVTIVHGSPRIYQALVDRQRGLPRSSSLLPDLRMLKGSVEPCSPDLFRAVERELGVVVAHDYGMAEAPVISASGQYHTTEQLTNTDGAPIPGIRVRIVERGVETALGRWGEIEVSGAALFRGYTDASLNDTAFTDDGWFRTGDRGRLRADGHLEVWAGAGQPR